MKKTRILLAALGVGAVVAAGVAGCDTEPEFQCEEVNLALAQSILDPGFTATSASAVRFESGEGWFVAIEVDREAVGVWGADSIEPSGPHSYVSVDHIADQVSRWPRMADENQAVALQTSERAKAAVKCVESR